MEEDWGYTVANGEFFLLHVILMQPCLNVGDRFVYLAARDDAACTDSKFILFIFRLIYFFYLNNSL